MRMPSSVLSSDFGVHPVATLIRGIVQFIDRAEIELYCPHSLK
jgi:predicted O-linked N-acetylglucosamine transferase (SPINDLY family)